MGFDFTLWWVAGSVMVTGLEVLGHGQSGLQKSEPVPSLVWVKGWKQEPLTRISVVWADRLLTVPVSSTVYGMFAE